MNIPKVAKDMILLTLWFNRLLLIFGGIGVAIVTPWLYIMESVGRMGAAFGSFGSTAFSSVFISLTMIPVALLIAVICLRVDELVPGRGLGAL